MSNSVRPHRWQPTRLRRPWDSLGKNTGVSCHFLLQCMKVKSGSEVAQSCPTLRNPMDCSLPGSSVHAIFQTRVLEWVPSPSPHLMLLFHILSLWTCSFMIGDSSGFESFLHRHFKYCSIHLSLKQTWGIGSEETAKHIIF